MRINLFVIGHSHMAATLRIVRLDEAFLPDGRKLEECDVAHIRFLSALRPEFSPHARTINGKLVFNTEFAHEIDRFLTLAPVQDDERIRSFGAFDAASKTIIISYIGGNAHYLTGILQHASPYDYTIEAKPDLPLLDDVTLVSEKSVYDMLQKRSIPHIAVLREVARRSRAPIIQLGAPPVLEDDALLERFLPDSLKPADGQLKISPAILRYKLWHTNASVYEDECKRLGVTFYSHPPESVDANGFLASTYQRNNDAMHANGDYARLVMAHVLASRETLSARGEEQPYRSLPDSAFWRRSVATLPGTDVDPVVAMPFRIRKSDPIVTAGSCFAQHIARRLSMSGYNFHVTEQAHPLMDKEESERLQYGVYSARYGNVYTARQLVQLFDRAFGNFHPAETTWRDGNRYRDPFRPTIPPEGFASERELLESRGLHLEATRRAFLEAGVFVFTLGLTECFEDTRDGAVFPLCPGTKGGEYDSGLFAFKNFSAKEVVDDLSEFITKLHAINKDVRIILTVSPVPLMASASGEHVLTATTYSKAVLRVAADEIARRFPQTAYFPSFEVITGNHARGAYFESDLRSVTKSGVDHVMRLFFAHGTVADESSEATPPPVKVDTKAQAAGDDLEAALGVICEEELLDAAGGTASH